MAQMSNKIEAFSDVKLSKTIAHALRHNPTIYGLELDEQGWAHVQTLLIGLRRRGFPNVTLAQIEGIVNGQREKIRYEFDENKQRIRATHGHSAVPTIDYEAICPPKILFHGTSPDAAKAIFNSGQLKPMSRNFVHLSSEKLTAINVARRKTNQPIILQINTIGALNAGIQFYRPVNETIWLSDTIPSKYISELNGIN